MVTTPNTTDHNKDRASSLVQKNINSIKKYADNIALQLQNKLIENKVNHIDVKLNISNSGIYFNFCYPGRYCDHHNQVAHLSIHYGKSYSPDLERPRNIHVLINKETHYNIEYNQEEKKYKAQLNKRITGIIKSIETVLNNTILDINPREKLSYDQ